jgi:hypothetical protein
VRTDGTGNEIVSEAEAEAARKLAEAVEGGDGAGADAEALAVVRLLASLRERPGDELAARRGALAAAEALRAATRKRRAVRLLAPLAATLVLAAGLAAGRRVVPNRVAEDVLAAREAQARAALAGLVSGPSEVRTARAVALLAGLSASRFDTYRRERSAGTAELATTRPSPRGTPSGGRS